MEYYAVASTLVKDVLGRLSSKDIQEFGLLWGFKDDVLSLKDDFDKIEAVLQDVEDSNSNEKKGVEIWLKSLKSASLEVDNVLDEISTEAMMQRLDKERGIIHSVSTFFSSDNNPLMFQVRIGYKVRAIREKMDVIASKRFELRLTPLDSISTRKSHSRVDVGDEGEMPDRETSSLIHDSSIIIGRTDDMKMTIDKICNKEIGKHENGEIRVYGIWGMGGVGKTTLAHLVFNHERVNNYFELKIWVYVSEKFNVKEIIKGIIESIDRSGECALPQLDMLQESLGFKLRGKRFLLVLDDVWIEDDEKNRWDSLSEPLSCGAEGSIVVMTTRYQKTSQMMAKVPELQHKLECLSEEDSWLLFKKLAFAEGRKGDDVRELEPIGREIVEKCKGLPLSVKTLGSLMWSKRSTRDWELVKGNIIRSIQEENNILKLSYDNLLPYVKRCFAYCCLFPKGYDMEKNVLISLWVSNGFIRAKGEEDLYKLGEEVFDYLVWRSFISRVKKLAGDRYILHNLMHDVARRVMGDDCLVIDPSRTEVEIPNEVLHLSSSCPNLLFSPQDLGKLTSLRSLFMFGKMNEGNCISQISNHAYLRVLYLRGIRLNRLPESVYKLRHLKYLNVSHSSIEVVPDSIVYLQNLQALVLCSCRMLRELPESICKLKQLKYLDLSHSSIEALPESIIHLRSLQVLLLCFCSCLRKLPEGLRHMTNLRCLDINFCYSLMQLPLGIQKLTNLRILSQFCLNGSSGARIGELGDLNLLEGELEIMPLESVEGLTEAKSANLKDKRNLRVLLLRWSAIRPWDTTRQSFRLRLDEEVLEGLEPNPRLEKLKINFNMGKTLSPSWILSLRNLTEISFYGCKNCERIPPLGRLPNLRVIDLSYMDSLKSFPDDKENMLSADHTTDHMFLCLQELRIYECPNFVSLPRNLPKLETLKLHGCNGLVSLPEKIQSFKHMNKLVVFKCKHLSKRCEREVGVDWPKISHIPNVYITSESP